MWIEATFRVTRDQLDQFSTDLLALDALGSYENLKPSEEVLAAFAPEPPPQEGDATLLAYFEDRDEYAFSELNAALTSLAHGTLISCERIPEGDWATAWKAHFKPLLIAPNVVICPSWETYTPKEKESVITLDPGMAFGTGSHDTTRFAAEFLTELYETVRQHTPTSHTSHIPSCASPQHFPLPPHESETKRDTFTPTLIDVGCGSGILALIATAIGFSPVVGIDNDESAVRVARENSELNPKLTTRSPHTSPLFFTCNDTLSFATEYTLPARFDVVVANIMAEALVTLKPHLLSLLKPSGFIVLSGIIPERTAMIETAFSDLTLIANKHSNEWHAYVFQR